jgi:NAD(P)-dependent dehydrogenase (short-subunit alcohol dehydrogenase family)
MLVVDADYEVREGDWEEGSRLAIMEFESPEIARHWYESEAGREAHALRQAAADCTVLIASGFVPKNPDNKLAVPESGVSSQGGPPSRFSTAPESSTVDPSLSGEALGRAPGRSRMVGRRVVVVGGGQTDFELQDQPIGNGRALGLLLAREGAHVLVVDRNEASAHESVELIRAEGGVADALVADVSEPRSIVEMITAADRQLNGIDGLVYNVGIPGPVGFEQNTAEAWDVTLDVNLRGAMLTARSALPVMEPGSSIVFISSIGAVRGIGRMIAYDASKAGLSSLVRATAIARKDDAIRANVVMLGMIDTGIGRDGDRNMPGRESIPVPLGRRGTAWEGAYASLFLLSREATFITGQTLAVDGGRTTLS